MQSPNPTTTTPVFISRVALMLLILVEMAPKLEKSSGVAIKGNRPRNARKLDAWAVQHLSVEEWTKLKAAIRKRRQRQNIEEKTVTVSIEAHKLLSRLARRDKVTYTEVLEHYLKKALRTPRGSAKTSRRKKR